MIIERIKKHEILSQYVEDTCCENEICVTFDEQIPFDSYAIIKVDKFYNSLNIEHRPASIDCLIVKKCIDGGYGMTLVELKNIKSSSAFEFENIKEKFETTLFDFIKEKFKEILYINYEEIKLFFVSKNEIYKRDLGLKMETLIETRFKFNGKTLMIIPKMPNPTIKNCYAKKYQQ
ncbi:MAG: hypothetical protein EAZ44_03485 [Cytophagia bacterium]|nr:MAG: hypothetical protein EAY69_10440 [Cytophagales bacterium]TAG05573.1 MAG: hypothetical protein EAZ44_03485 [Cytophagia bacterium]TAG43923.1 MAG: hypothetical protein EAZ31_03220 [Cytophagia bacterium]